MYTNNALDLPIIQYHVLVEVHGSPFNTAYMEVERSPSPVPHSFGEPFRHTFESLYSDENCDQLEQSFLRRNTWYEKERSRKRAHITQEEDDDNDNSRSDSCATHFQDCKRFKGSDSRGRTPTRGRPIASVDLPFNPHNTPVKKTQETEEVELCYFNHEDGVEKIDETTTSSSSSHGENSMHMVDADLLTYSTELIFNGPFEEIFSKLADCFVLQRERILAYYHNTSCMSYYKAGPGLVFSFLGDSGSDDNLTCSASFQTEFKADNIFPRSSQHTFETADKDNMIVDCSRLVYFHKGDHGTLFDFNVKIGVPVTLSNSLILLKPPVGFCFGGEDVLIMVNQQMLRTLFDFHMQKEYGKPFLDITSNQHQDIIAPFATPNTSTGAIQRALEDRNTFTLFTDVGVGSCILFLCTTFTKSFINQELLGDFDNMALLDFHASAHVRRLAYHRGIKCLDCDNLTQKIAILSGSSSSSSSSSSCGGADQSQWQACLNSSRKADVVHHLVQSFSEEDYFSTKGGNLLPFYNEEEEVTLETISNAILFQQHKRKRPLRRHIPIAREMSIDFHHETTKDEQQQQQQRGYCFLMSNPLLTPYNGSLDTANLSKHTCINNLLLQLSENNRANYNNWHSAAQNHTYSSKSGDLLGFFRL